MSGLLSTRNMVLLHRLLLRAKLWDAMSDGFGIRFQLDVKQKFIHLRNWHTYVLYVKSC